MYNSHRLSRSTRTLQRRKVDTGITIDPTKVQAYKNYLLNNGYVQLPRPPCPPPPPPDGTYLFTSNADYDVSPLMTTSYIYADEFISAVLSTQNIILTGTETVYIELQTTVDQNDGIDILIHNQSDHLNQFTTQYSRTTTGQPVTYTILFIFCNGQYSIVLLGANGSSIQQIYKADPTGAPERTYIDFEATATFTNSKVTIVAVGIQ